jgi:hypothetical protein
MQFLELHNHIQQVQLSAIAGSGRQVHLEVELIQELLHSISLLCFISWPDRGGKGKAALESAHSQQSLLLHVASLDGEMLDIGAAMATWSMLCLLLHVVLVRGRDFIPPPVAMPLHV